MRINRTNLRSIAALLFNVAAVLQMSPRAVALDKPEPVKLSAAETTAATDTLPQPPPGKKFELVWHDEFNGANLATSTWNYTNGPRHDAFWSEDAVQLDGKGNLVIYAMKDGDRYIDGVIDTQRKFEHSFGYYVARVQLQKQPGHWTAFWLMGDKVGRKGDKGRDGTEIDIYEKTDLSEVVLHNLHWDSYCDIFCEAGTRREIPGVTNGFHTFSVWWKPDEYIFYVDGKETWRTNAGGVCQEPLYVMFSDEIGKWAGDIKKATLPDFFLVDYVRVYDVVDAE